MKKTEREQLQEVKKILGDNYVYEKPIYTKNGEVLRHDYIEKKQFKELEKTYEKSEITTNVNEQLQSLEERLLQKLSQQEPQIKQETQNTNFDLEEQFEKFLAHRNDFDKIGEDRRN